MKKIIILLACLFALIPSVWAYDIFQDAETSANCVAGSWNAACAYTHDDDWNTGAYCNDGWSNCIAYYNFTIPSDYEVKYYVTCEGGCGGLSFSANRTVPSLCASQNPFQTYVQSDASVGDHNVPWYCYNGTAFEQITNIPDVVDVYDSGIYLHRASLNITVYDETAPTTQIYSNITVTNSTTTLTYTNVTSINVFDTDITGSLTITANDYAGNYAQRQITETITGNLINRNIYLIQSALSFQIDLNVYDSLSTGITGALVNISRQSGYNYNYVTECTTDSAGYCFVTLNDTATYKFVVSKSGYVTKTQYITPTLTAYSFTLQTPTPSINFTSELGGVTMLLTPQITALKKSNAQPFNFTITSNETLTSWGMQILWQNYTGTSLFTSTQSAAYGGSVNATINTTLYNGTVVVRTFLQRDGYSLRSYYTNYTIHTITPYNHSLYNLIPDLQTNYAGTFNNLFITLALLLFIVFAAALFGLGTEVSGALLFIGLGYLSFFGLIPFNLFLLAMILFMSYLLWKG